MNDFYEARNSNYCYPNSNILINKLDIHDRKKLEYYEARITAAKLLALRKIGITGNFDIEHLVGIHKYIFEDIYPFAGKFRNENIAKGSFRFAQWEFIEPELRRILDKLKKENYLEGLDKQMLAKKIAYYMAEINVLHPFREGNGRSTREFIRQLLLKNGYVLDLKKVEPKDMLEASIESVANEEKLSKYIEKCIEIKKPEA